MIVLSSDLEFDRTYSRTPPIWDAPTGIFRASDDKLMSIITYTDIDDEVLMDPNLIITQLFLEQTVESLMECCICRELLEYHSLLKFITYKLKYIKH